jgi:hypothetical protein
MCVNPLGGSKHLLIVVKSILSKSLVYRYIGHGFLMLISTDLNSQNKLKIVGKGEFLSNFCGSVIGLSNQGYLTKLPTAICQIHCYCIDNYIYRSIIYTVDSRINSIDTRPAIFSGNFN